MRPDQLARLSDLSEKLADVVLEEADPEAWPGAGQPLADLSKDDRGDRYWCKRNAAATLGLLVSVERVRANTREALGRDPRDDEELDDEIKSAEKAAAKLLAKVQGGRKTVKG